MQGILIINKPKGYTSQDVVSKVKKILNVKKAGHTGTLDPLATGVLPIMLGNYTKISKYLIEHDKKYIAKMRLGEKTSTGDLEGKIIETKNIDEQLSFSNINNVLNSFIGIQKQIPPKYSAIKVNGKKLYEYARNNEEVEIPERKIEIYNINLIDYINYELTFEVSCSKGTYLRTLCENIAEKLGTVGVMTSLVRTKVDKFSIEDAIQLDELNIRIAEEKCINMESIFFDFENIKLDSRKKSLFLNGVMLTVELNDGIYNIYTENNVYLGTGIVKNNLLKRDVIIYDGI